MQVIFYVQSISTSTFKVLLPFFYSRNSKDLSVIPQLSDVAEDRFLMIDRAKIFALRTNLKEAELALEILKKVRWAVYASDS